MHYFLIFFLVIYPFCIFPWGPDPYYTVPKAIYLICFSFLFWIAYLLHILKGRVQTKLTKVEALIVCFLILISISTIFSIDTNLSLVGSKDRYEGFLAWICYSSLFYFSYRFFEPIKREAMYFWVSLSGIVVAIYAILQHFLVDFLPRNSDKLFWTRSYAFFDNPNFYGTFTVIILLLAMMAYLEEKQKVKLCFYYMVICIVFVSLLYSLTRSAWLGSFVGFFVLSIYVLYRKLLWKRWLALSIGLAIMFIGVNVTEGNSTLYRSQSIVSEGVKVLEGDSHAGSSRFYIWKKSFPLLKDYFLFGAGPDTFGEVFPYEKQELKLYFGTDNIYVDKAHNEYLQIGITMGIPALIVYLLIVSIAVIRLCRNSQAFNDGDGSCYYLRFSKDSYTDDETYRIGLIAIIIGYLIQAFFNISVISVAPYFWFVLGMAYQFSRR